MPAEPFRSPEYLRAAFLAGLRRLLADQGLGAHVLVLANATFDPDVMDPLRGPLGERFTAQVARCREAFAHGREVPDADDDLLVLLKLALLGFAGLGVTELRRADPWEIQFNLLRAFRPKRMSASPAAGIQVPFRADGFHFNRPLLRRETFWSGELAGRSVDLLYNKFPFVELHGLLVPERERCLPQFLTRDYHFFVWRLVEELGPTLPGLGLAYNSYGAHASVNHLHFQTFLRRRPLPLLDPRWRHNGGVEPYPAPCRLLRDPQEAWERLDRLHKGDRPYNLIYLPGSLYCLPRVRQGDYQPPPWSTGLAWYEMAGGVIAFDRDQYARLEGAEVAAELRRVGVAE
jgi:hypothetical protein